MTIETANRLYELRKKQGLSQEELAEKLGVSRQAVSKWERSEASPDTDNLIALAKIYDLTLDELIYGEKQSKETEKTEAEEKVENEENAETNTEETIEADSKKNKGTNKVNIGPAGIFIESDDGDKVQINLRGIKITEGKNHIHINDEDDDDEDDDEDNEDLDVSVSSKRKDKFWLSVPYPIICVIAYLIFGFGNICGGWALSWIIFITIPLYYSLVEAIYDRRLCNFAYPVLTAFIYLYLGLYHGNWHPSWIIFITVPVYYPIAAAIDKRIRRNR